MDQIRTTESSRTGGHVQATCEPCSRFQPVEALGPPGMMTAGRSSRGEWRLDRLARGPETQILPLRSFLDHPAFAGSLS